MPASTTLSATEIAHLKTLHELLSTLPQTGCVEWIGLRPARREAMVAVQSVEALVDSGLRGDRYASSGKRQVTLIQAEHLRVLEQLLAKPVEPAMLRRNVVVSGINVIALKGARFRVGEALLVGTGPCEPCSRMEEALGPGGYNAMRGHGGITARIVEPGRINVGDAITFEDLESDGPQTDGRAG
jgi:MOSC domain-containing protein YiiM